MPAAAMSTVTLNTTPVEKTAIAGSMFLVFCVSSCLAQEQGGVKYILLPQIASSGAGQRFQEVAPKGKSGKPGKPET